MPVEFSKADVIEKNKTAIEVCNQTIERLKKLGEQGLFPDDEADRLIQLSRATNERTSLRQVNAHLRAAGTSVKPMADKLAKELNDLGNKLDEQIQKDLITNATIDFITSVLSDAARLRAITDSHKA